MNRRAYERARLAISVTLAVAMGSYLVATSESSHKSASPPKHAVATKAGRILIADTDLIQGGALVSAAQARGVNCPGSYDGYSQTDSKELTVDSELDPQYSEVNGTPTVFVGLDADQEFGGFYALKSGWALLFHQRNQSYQLDHFVAKQQVINYPSGPSYAAELVGRPVTRTDLAGLELGAMKTYSDGATSVSITTDFDQELAQQPIGPMIDISIRCAAP